MATLNMGNGNVIGISYSEMNKMKSNLKRSQQMIETSQRNVGTARVQLQVDRGRLRVTEDSLSSIYTEESKRKNKIDKMCSNIDYTIRRFKEVDSRCAQRIKSIGNSYNTKTSLFDKIKNVMISLGRYLFGGGTSLLNEGQDAFNNLGSGNSNGYYSFIGRGAGVGNYSAMANSQYSMGGLLLAGTNIYNSKYRTVSYLHEFNFYRNFNNDTEENTYFKGETSFNQMTEEQKADWEKWERLNREPQAGDAGDGVLGKIYDAYLNSIVYKGLYKLSRFEEQNPEFLKLMVMLTFWQSARIDIKTYMTNKEISKEINMEISKTEAEAIKQKLKNNVSNVRSKMPNTNLSKRGNMAAAEVDIDGVKTEFIAHSKINSVESKGSDVSKFSYLKPEDKRLFSSYVDDSFPRYHDTEAKILEDIATQIKNPYASGTINLYSELPCCQSCSNLILEFRQKFPNIKLNIYVE